MNPNKYNVLILGSGGREHTLAWKIAQSPLLHQLHIAPGNGGTASIATQINLSVNDFEGIGEYCLSANINVIIVGPEDPLVLGISDYFAQEEKLKSIFVFGPNKTAAQLEGSKDFSKQFMFRHDIPTAKYKTFAAGQEKEAAAFLTTMNAPYVLKVDGLAAGKGVLILGDLKEAQTNAAEILNGRFGAANNKLVIEEFLDGIEVSYFTMHDGESYVLLPEAKDYKRIGEGDTGLNTGGMGAVSPVPFANDDFTQKVIKTIINPTVKGLKMEGIKYVGFIFFGLINVNGEPKVIEYNCRMGDPETEVVIPRLKTDLLAAVIAAKNKNLANFSVTFKNQYATSVILVSGGYPEAYEKGKNIALPNTFTEHQLLFHSGTKDENNLVTNGGRVFACTGLGTDLKSALKESFHLAEGITYEGKFYRKDIGKDLTQNSND